jgi:hypothetical protein
MNLSQFSQAPPAPSVTNQPQSGWVLEALAPSARRPGTRNGAIPADADIPARPPRFTVGAGRGPVRGG